MRLAIAFPLFCGSVFGQMLGLVSPGPGTVHTTTTGGGATCTPRTGYSHCRALTIASGQTGGTTLTNFPVVIQTGPSTPIMLGPSVNSTCSNVAFTTDAIGATLTPWEVEACPNTGAILAHVLSPSITDAGGFLYVHYGGTTTGENTGANGPTHVWDSSYVGVWHLATTAAPNSTATTGVNGTNNGCTNTTGELDGAITCASNPATYISVGSGNAVNTAMNSNTYTVTAWINGTTGAAENNFFGHRGSAHARCIVLYGNSKTLALLQEEVATAGQSAANTAPIDGNWHLVQWTNNGTSYAVMFDNVSIMSGNYTWSGSYAGEYDISDHQNTTGFNGSLDEVRVSSIVRPAGWLTAEFLNQKSGSTFLTWGPEI